MVLSIFVGKDKEGLRRCKWFFENQEARIKSQEAKQKWMEMGLDLKYSAKCPAGIERLGAVVIDENSAETEISKNCSAEFPYFGRCF